MKTIVYTSERSMSLRKVAEDVARVLTEEKDADVRLILSPDVGPWHYRDRDSAVVVMTFDAIWAKPFFVLAWLLQREGLRVIFYTTTEGYPRRLIGDEWIYRDLSFVANSKYTASRLKAVGAVVTDVVYHGIWVENVTGMEFMRETARATWGFSENDFVVGYIAGAYNRKGHTQFAEVARIIGKKDPTIKFAILTQPQAAHLYHGLENCFVSDEFGQLDEAMIFSTYHAFDLYAQASLSEGFGLPVLEALAAGKPVVHADYEPLSEITTPETSYRVPVKAVIVDKTAFRQHIGIDYELHLYDPQEFAEVILQAKEDVVNRRKELRDLCIERAMQFHARKTYMRIAELLA